MYAMQFTVRLPAEYFGAYESESESVCVIGLDGVCVCVARVYELCVQAEC